jgi:radical SAM protein with 4Fe4S-binding SPASM domain
MRESRGEIHLLLHPDHPTWCAVNDFGLEVARLTDGSCSIEEFCTEISTRYEVASEEVRGPVERFLAQLEAAGFLLDAEAPPPDPRPPPRVRVEHLNLHVAKGCNLRCSHCAVIDGYVHGKQLAKHEIFRAIDQLAELEGASVALSGGEPLLRRDLPELLEYAAGKVRVVLSTNGMLIDEEIAVQLARVGATIEISIDGSCARIHDRIRGPGAFEATMKGIERLAAAGIAHQIRFATTLTKVNLGDLDPIISLAERLGVGFVRFSPVQPIERADRHWDEVGLTPDELRKAYRFLYLELGKRRVDISGGFPGFVLDFAKGEQWCALGRTLALDPEGNIYPCQLFQQPEYKVGNVSEMSLREATESPRLLETLRDAASRKYVVEACKSCNWRNFCQGSCSASVQWQKETLWATDDLCDARRELYRDVVFGIAEGQVNAHQAIARAAGD